MPTALAVEKLAPLVRKVLPIARLYPWVFYPKNTSTSPNFEQFLGFVEQFCCWPLLGLLKVGPDAYVDAITSDDPSQAQVAIRRSVYSVTALFLGALTVPFSILATATAMRDVFSRLADPSAENFTEIGKLILRLLVAG